jgi:hypothetical protein
MHSTCGKCSNIFLYGITVELTPLEVAENGQLGIGHDKDMNYPVGVPAMSSLSRFFDRKCSAQDLHIVCSSKSTFAYFR